jgi:peptide/nickel transport system substrate-binding protein
MGLLSDTSPLVKALAGGALLLVCTAAGFALTNCSGSTPAPTPDGEPAAESGPVDGDTLILTVSLDPDNINPLVAPYSLSGWVIDLVNPGLVRRVVSDDGLSYEPALAERWEWADEGLSLTYHLRPGLKWEDGTPLTAHDVAFTFELMADPDVASNWLGDAKNIAGVDVIDDLTARFRFVEARNPILQQGITHYGIVAKHVFEKIDRASIRSAAASRRPPASGSWRVSDWKANERLILEPNPMAPADWKPHLERIIFMIQPEANTRNLTMMSKKADYDGSVEYSQVKGYMDAPHLDVHVEPAGAMMYLGYNLTLDKWKDPRVRRALTLATDRQSIMDRIFSFDGQSYARECVGTVGPTLGRWYAADLKPLPYDPVESARLLDEAGWKDTDGDGIRDKGGQPLRAVVMVQNGTDMYRDTAVLIQGQWAKVGVKLELEMLDTTTFADRARNKKYDAVFWLFGNNPKVDPSIQWASDGRYNWFGYSNPEVDALLKKGQTSLDLEEAQAAIREAQRLVHADQPVTFLAWLDEVVVVDKRFRDIDYNIFSGVAHSEKWWVPAAEQRY